MELNIDQKALIQWITAGLAIKEVRELHGGAPYLFSKMIAKVTLAADQYFLSVNALNRLNQDNINLEKVYKRSTFYGKKSPYMYEHTIPASIVRSKLLTVPPLEEEVINVLNAAGHVVMILREEDNLLRSNGLTRKMPHGWEWGDDPFARYHSSGIELSKTRIMMKGIICR